MPVVDGLMTPALVQCAIDSAPPTVDLFLLFEGIADGPYNETHARLDTVGPSPGEGESLPRTLGLIAAFLSTTSTASPTLTVSPNPVYGDQPTTVRLVGANPGDEWVIVVSTTTLAAPTCPPMLNGACLDLTEPSHDFHVTVDATGGATHVLVVSPDPGGTRFFQAARLNGPPDVSNLAQAVFLPVDADSDRDGLTDLDERSLGTDPWARDTDGDELFDGAELSVGSNPLNPDTDADGRPDGWDSRPLNPDLPDPFQGCDAPAGDPSANVMDPEFDSLNGRFVFQEKDGSAVWVGHIDGATGDLIPPDGRGVLLATSVPTMGVSRNGPEWVNTEHGMVVVLSRLRGGQPIVSSARLTTHGWRIRDLPGSPTGYGAFGTLEPDDPNPRVMFKVDDPVEGVVLQWQELLTEVGGRMPFAVADTRWGPGGLHALGLAYDNGVQQAFLYDVYSDRHQQLTFGPEDTRNPMCWFAPDFSDEIVCVVREVAVDRDGTLLRVYRRDAQGGYTTWEIAPPAGWPHIDSAEPFVYNGASYVTFATTRRGSKKSPGHIYVAPITPNGPQARRLTDDRITERRDPEVFLGGIEPWIYYAEMVDDRQILHRTCTGLP